MTAPVPPEVVVETVARAMAASDGNDWDVTILRSYYCRHAAAAIAAMPPSPAEEAVKRVEALAEELGAPILAGPCAGQTPLYGGGDVAYRLRAALASPAPAPQGEEPADCGCGVPGCVWGHGA